MTKLERERQELIAELQRFVDYYKKAGRLTWLGNGEAQQHWTRSSQLLDRIKHSEPR